MSVIIRLEVVNLEKLVTTQIQHFSMEVVYLAIISFICLMIYLRTRGIYKLSMHKGMFHFRNIFLFFFAAYIFRFVFTALFLAQGMINPRTFWEPQFFAFGVAGYFSTVAILSIAMAITSKNLNISNKNATIIINMSALALSLLLFFIMLPDLLVIIQTLVFAAAMLLLLLRSRRKRQHKASRQNLIIYMSLFAFWIINLFVSNRMLPIEMKAIFYAVSSLLFLSIYVRVNKRLKNAEEKGKT